MGWVSIVSQLGIHRLNISELESSGNDLVGVFQAVKRLKILKIFSIVSQLGIHRLNISELGSSGNDRSGSITLDHNVFICI